MGDPDVTPSALEFGQVRAFEQRLLQDLRALQTMVEGGLFEKEVHRIGAEQELFFVDESWRPAPVAMEVLEHLRDPHFTTELARFNFEFNVDPIPFGPGCLVELERRLTGLIERVREAAREYGAEVVLMGILPSVSKSDLHLRNMSPGLRYKVLNDAMGRLRGGDYSFHIHGKDELLIRHDNVMLEACNTSFQVHFQVGATEFARRYNIAQAVAAPVLACATNSPLLFGRQLWRETRIALFEQSVDTRSPTTHLRDQLGRVSFGRRWVDESPVEIYQDDIARLRVILRSDADENPFEALARGEAPQLAALCLFNGTVYRWNRPCYGVTDGEAHLRIENRVLPSGPTVLDEVANAALWFGLMAGMAELYPDVRRVMHFDMARENFFAAARLGLGATLDWPGRGVVGATELLREQLMPLARSGLGASGLTGEEIERYLGVLDERVSSGRTGSQWLIDSAAALRREASRSETLAALVAVVAKRQREERPVHEWPVATFEEARPLKSRYRRIEELMTTELLTVKEEDVVDMAAAVMSWRHVRRIPVEDDQHHLVGLVTYRSLLRVFSEREGSAPIPVREVMQRDIVTVSPETSALEALRLMQERRIGCLPVVDHEGRLVGIITEHDFTEIARPLLEKELKRE